MNAAETTVVGTAGAAAAVVAFGLPLGSVRAIYLLGLCYRDGEGVEKDLKYSRELFREAARRGCDEAKRELAKSSRRR